MDTVKKWVKYGLRAVVFLLNEIQTSDKDYEQQLYEDYKNSGVPVSFHQWKQGFRTGDE